MSASAEIDTFRQPVVRHLAWLCRAPQLYTGALTFDPLRWLPPGYVQRLQYWDQHPESMPELLRQPAPPRLGRYFEQLYACLLSDVLGWSLLARNVQVRDQRRTLGELDFLVRNPHTGVVEHHEIAVKFYLGHVDAAYGRVLWYGPNSRDRLDLKTAHLLQHQTRLAAGAAARPMLRALGINTPPEPRIFMPGYLFYPLGAEVAAPEQAAQGHGRGRWCHVSAAERVKSEGWVILHKPHWLSDWCQAAVPESETLSHAVAEVKRSGRACLLARLAVGTSGWQEVERLFVVPDSWPGVPSRG